jgi:hypothetical protein
VGRPNRPPPVRGPGPASLGAPGASSSATATPSASADAPPAIPRGAPGLLWGVPGLLWSVPGLLWVVPGLLWGVPGDESGCGAVRCDPDPLSSGRPPGCPPGRPAGATDGRPVTYRKYRCRLSRPPQTIKRAPGRWPGARSPHNCGRLWRPGGPPRSAGHSLDELACGPSGPPPGLSSPVSAWSGSSACMTETTSSALSGRSPSHDHPSYTYDATSWCLCEYPRSGP